MEVLTNKSQIFTMVKFAIGQHGVRSLRLLLKLASKAASWEENFQFCCFCRDTEFIPPSLRTKPKVITKEGVSATRRYDMANLKARLHQASIEMNRCRQAVFDQLLCLSKLLPDEFTIEIAAMVGAHQAKIKDMIIKRHNRKKENWSNPGIPINTTRKTWVCNLSSSFIPSAVELEVLSKGLNFAVSKPIKPLDVIAPLEAILTTNPSFVENAEMIRAEVAVALKHAKPPEQNLSRASRNALRNLKKRADLYFARADKGNTVVIMDIVHYNKLCLEFLTKGGFTEIPADPTTTVEGRLIRALQKLRKEKKIDDREYRQAYCSSGSIPLLRGLPKLHKSPISVRPIISYNRSPLCPLSKLLANILKPITKEIRSATPSSSHLINKIKDIKIPDEYILVSFDVVNLYPSIPHEAAMKVVQKYLRADRALNQRTTIPVEDIMKLISLCLENTFFYFDGKYYQQIHGTPMGSPLSEPIATLLLAMIEDEIVSKMGSDILCWFRYVDDGLAIIKKNKLTQIINLLNNACEGIAFTHEIEKDGSLPYLDMLITRKDQNLSFSVYRKPTHTGLYFNYKSEHPRSQKLSIPRTLSTRAHGICTESSKMKQEISLISEMLVDNGYPKQLLEKTLVQKANVPKKEKETKEPEAILSLPYCSSISFHLAKTLGKFGIKVIHKPVNKIYSILRGPDPTPIVKRSGVVYKVHCGVHDCEATYIGETGRRLETRLKEHAKDVTNQSEKTALSRHATKERHKFDFNSAEILRSERRPQIRLQYESLAIAAATESVNTKVPCHPLYNHFLEHAKTRHRKIQAISKQTAVFEKQNAANSDALVAKFPKPREPQPR